MQFVHKFRVWGSRLACLGEGVRHAIVNGDCS